MGSKHSCLPFLDVQPLSLHAGKSLRYYSLFYQLKILVQSLVSLVIYRYYWADWLIWLSQSPVYFFTYSHPFLSQISEHPQINHAFYLCLLVLVGWPGSPFHSNKPLIYHNSLFLEHVKIYLPILFIRPKIFPYFDKLTKIRNTFLFNFVWSLHLLHSCKNFFTF